MHIIRLGWTMPLKMYKEDHSSVPKIKSIIGIAAGKGGVGKSTVCVNLAHTLKKAGMKVGIMDTDIYGPSIRKMLPEDRFPEQIGERIKPALCQGIRMISMAYFRKENEAAVVRAPIANGVILQFLKNVDWGQLDYLLIDFPPGTGDIQLTLAQQANMTGAIVVTTPQQVAVMDVRKAMHMFEQVNIPVIGVVENMSGYYHHEEDTPVYLFGKGGGESLALEKGVPFLGSIPLDPDLCQSGDKGRSLYSEGAARLQTIRSFEKLAELTMIHSKALVDSQRKGMTSFDIQWKEMTADE